MVSRREFLKAVAVLTGGALVGPLVKLETGPEEALPVVEEAPVILPMAERPDLSGHPYWVEIDGEYIPALNLEISISVPTHSYINHDGFLVDVPVSKSWDAHITTMGNHLVFIANKIGELVPVAFIVDYVKIAEGECYIASVKRDHMGLNHCDLSGHRSFKSMYEPM